MKMGDSEMSVSSSLCPPGMHDCNGNCVTYQCWGTSSTAMTAYYNLQLSLDALEAALKVWCNVPNDPDETASRVAEVGNMLKPIFKKAQP